MPIMKKGKRWKIAERVTLMQSTYKVYTAVLAESVRGISSGIDNFARDAAAVVSNFINSEYAHREGSALPPGAEDEKRQRKIMEKRRRGQGSR